MGKLKGFWSFLSEQGRDLPLPRESVIGKTIVLTGANVGLGIEASTHFASKRPGLLIATCRDTVKCEKTLEILRERCAGTQPSSLDSWPLELSSFDNVRSFVDRFGAEGPERLNILVANAGTFRPVYTRTQDDWEVMLQVNYLSMALLSILLLPHLLRSATCDDPSRLVLVSSLGHYLAGPMLTGSQNWDHVLGAISAEKFGVSGASRYNLSKLLQVAFVRELAARLPSPTPLVVTAVDPGFCHSSLQRELEKYWLLRMVLAFVKWLLRARTSEMGSRNLVYAALATNAQAVHGKYMSSCEVVEECDYLLSAEGKVFSERLWGETIEVLSRVDDRVPQIKLHVRNCGTFIIGGFCIRAQSVTQDRIVTTLEPTADTPELSLSQDCAYAVIIRPVVSTDAPRLRSTFSACIRCSLDCKSLPCLVIQLGFHSSYVPDCLLNSQLAIQIGFHSPYVPDCLFNYTGKISPSTKLYIFMVPFYDIPTPSDFAILI